MKKISTLNIALFSLLVLFISSSASAECTTEDGAYNMMMASQVHSNKLYQKFNVAKIIYEKANSDYRKRKLKSSKEEAKIKVLYQKQQETASRWAQQVKDISPVSRLINQKKYEEACQQYSDIAKKYGFDMAKTQKKTITVADIKKDGASNGKECGLSDASVALMFLLQDTAKSGKEYKSLNVLSNKATTLMLQNPNELCQELKQVTKKIGISYDDLMARTKSHLEKNKKSTAQRSKIIDSNASKNIKCSVNDAIELSYKKNDFSKKLVHKVEIVKDRIIQAKNARLYNSALVKKLEIERKRRNRIVHDFYDEFKADVKVNIENGQYDKACDNYAALVKKYTSATPGPSSTIKIATSTVASNQTNKQNRKASNPTSKEPSNASLKAVKQDVYDAVANKKYNYLVDVINKFSPKIYSSFKTYATTAGTDKNKRQKNQYTSLGGMKMKMPNLYIVRVYFDGSYKTNAVHALEEALAINRLTDSDVHIKNYLDSIEKFTKLFTQASEYYEMKDYTDDDFKKADEMHKPLVMSFEKFMQSDEEVRKIIENIEDKQTQKRIQAYKASNQMLFYYVENAQYLSKKYFRYARHKHFLKLDAKKVRAMHDQLRDHYSAFKTYKQGNEIIFKDNHAYTSYLGDFRNFISSSKDFYIRVKSKKAYPNGEGAMLKHVPPQAREAIEANIKGSVQHLLKSYNALVGEYNGLNM